MKQRCLNPNTKEYKWYGARGIRVCERWMKFENFLKDMGRRPKGLTLDRKNTDGNYEPTNCRWASMKVQENNRRNSSGRDFESVASRLGISKGAVRMRWYKGKVEVPLLSYATAKHIQKLIR